MIKLKNSLLMFSLIILFFFSPLYAQAKNLHQDLPVVRAVLFFSPTCGHCQQVIQEDLPPLIEKYGEQLQIMGINVSTEEGQILYQSFINSWEIPDERIGVPTLVVGEVYLVGSGDIPSQFPAIIEDSMHEGGIDWPQIPGLLEIIAEVERPTPTNLGETATVDPEMKVSLTVTKITQQDQGNEDEIGSTIIGKTPEASNDQTSSFDLQAPTEITVMDRFKQDLAGNILAVITLVAMLISVIWTLIRILTPTNTTHSNWPLWIPILSFFGLIVAGYLSFVEVTQSEAVCGPIGNCNAVQESPYAMLFGFLPVGILGLIGYIVILLSWILQRYGPKEWHKFFTLSIWGMAFFGVIFSIYLTFLEPFVIGATCAWCISSAVIITLLLLFSTEPVRQIWGEDDWEEIAYSEVNSRFDE